MREWWVLVQEQPHCHWELRIRLMSTSFPLPHYTSPCHGYSPNPTLLSWLPPHAAAMATTELLQLMTSETETYDSYGYGIAMEWLQLQLWLWPISDALHKATITAIPAARPPSQLRLLFQQIQDYLLPQLLFLLLAACCLLHLPSHQHTLLYSHQSYCCCCHCHCHTAILIANKTDILVDIETFFWHTSYSCWQEG